MAIPMDGQDDDAGDSRPDEVTGYAPTLTREELARIAAWHDTAIHAARAEAGDDGQTFEYFDRTLIVPPQVQPITGMSHLFGTAVLTEVRASDRVLDMGTGCGVNAILAAATAHEVVAVDVNPHAVAAARANAARNGVASRVTVLEGDLFAPVSGCFDLILFDPPFRWFRARDWLEAGMTDQGYRTLTSFFREARDYLTDDGRMLISFGTSGDLAYLLRQAVAARFAVETLTLSTLRRQDQDVTYLVMRMTPVP